MMKDKSIAGCLWDFAVFMFKLAVILLPLAITSQLKPLPGMESVGGGSGIIDFPPMILPFLQ